MTDEVEISSGQNTSSPACAGASPQGEAYKRCSAITSHPVGANCVRPLGRNAFVGGIHEWPVLRGRCANCRETQFTHRLVGEAFRLPFCPVRMLAGGRPIPTRVRVDFIPLNGTSWAPSPTKTDMPTVQSANSVGAGASTARPYILLRGRSVSTVSS